MDNGTVLIVDADPSALGGMRDILESLGCRVVSVGSASEATEVLKDYRWDAAFLDSGAGGGGGLDLLAQLRDRVPGLAVALMSGVVSPTSLDVARRAGASGYLVKPFTAREVEDELIRALRATDLARQRGRVVTAIGRVRSLGRHRERMEVQGRS